MTKDEITALADAISAKLAPYRKDILSLDEAAKYTGLKKSYLYKLTAAKAIPHYKPNGKNCFFKRTELEEWLTTNPVKTTAELNAEAQTYCMKKRNHLK